MAADCTCSVLGVMGSLSMSSICWNVRTQVMTVVCVLFLSGPGATDPVTASGRLRAGGTSSSAATWLEGVCHGAPESVRCADLVVCVHVEVRLQCDDTCSGPLYARECDIGSQRIDTFPVECTTCTSSHHTAPLESLVDDQYVLACVKK